MIEGAPCAIHSRPRSQRGDKLVGLWLSMAHPYSAEICATAGFQWLLIDGEHAPNDVRSTLAQLQAVAPYPAHPVVRAVSGDPALIKQLLDIGVQTLLVPMVDTPEQAAALVAATRYPPQGTRGVGAAVARASRWGARRDYLETANDDTCLLVQAETVTALAQPRAHLRGRRRGRRVHRAGRPGRIDGPPRPARPSGSAGRHRSRRSGPSSPAARPPAR